LFSALFVQKGNLFALICDQHNIGSRIFSAHLAQEHATVTTDTALICSGSPGFLRSLGSALTGRVRLMECYTPTEVPRLSLAQQARHVVIDQRGASVQQLARTWAVLTQFACPRVVIVVNRGQLSDTSIPREIAHRVEAVEVDRNDENYQELAERVLSSRAVPLPAAATQTAGAASANGSAGTNGTTSQNGMSTANGSGSHGFAAGTGRSTAVATAQPTPASPEARPRFSANEVPAPVAVPGNLFEKLSLSQSESQASIERNRSNQLECCQIADQFRTRTPELRQMLKRLEVAARHSVTILLIGETGSGKTHLANLIHSMSPRASEPFLHVACGALPGELIESELFGHVKGAFTSAHADKDGKFIAAGNGTILLDEIDVLTPDQQVKLLRVIETGEFEPVGSNRTLKVKARIIAASNLQLQPLVEQGRFRPDLYYRLNTLSFVIPPLRKRLPDIEPLARYFVHYHAGQLGVDILDVEEEFIERLLQYPWPGNVRELENAIRSAVIYSQHGRMTSDCLPTHIVAGNAGPANDPSVSGFFSVRRGESLENRMEVTEKEMIEQALLKNNFSRTNTARHLGISRVTLYNKMRKYGMLGKNVTE
jgi:DNA-binding NtrC family response regulator